MAIDDLTLQVRRVVKAGDRRAANLFALRAQGADFFLKIFYDRLLFVELRVKRFRTLLGGGTSLAFALDQLDGTGNSFFQSGKIAAAESKVCG